MDDLRTKPGLLESNHGSFHSSEDRTGSGSFVTKGRLFKPGAWRLSEARQEISKIEVEVSLQEIGKQGGRLEGDVKGT